MITAEQLIELAEKLSGVLREDQLERIRKIASTLSDEQREKLHAKLMNLDQARSTNEQHEIDVRQKMNAAYKEFEGHKKTEAIKAEESKDRLEADAEAERLLEELNNL
jgi:hypothetical protein